jgi:hypothetical protein
MTQYISNGFNKPWRRADSLNIGTQPVPTVLRFAIWMMFRDGLPKDWGK